MIFIASLVLLLIIKLRFPKGKSIHRLFLFLLGFIEHSSVAVRITKKQLTITIVMEKKRKIKEQMKIILAQYFEIFQISSSGKIYNKNIME